MRAWLCIIAVLGVLGVAGCVSTPEDRLAQEFGLYDNSCLPTAIAFAEGLESRGVWARVVIYKFERSITAGRGPDGHAVCAYIYPKSGPQQLWTYDAWGSYRTIAPTNDPLRLARNAHAVRGFIEPVLSARFLYSAEEENAP